MKHALILGCSHAAGSEMHKGPGLMFESQEEILRYGPNRSYPVLIAKQLGYDRIDNQAIPGGSNDAMFRIFESASLEPEDLVVACWTGLNRSEFYDNQWIGLAAGKSIDAKYETYFKQWLLYNATDTANRLNKIKNIVALNAIAQQQGVRVINIDSFWPVSDFKRYGYWPVRQDFSAWCTYRKYSKTDQGHFFDDAHQAFANYVLEHIC